MPIRPLPNDPSFDHLRRQAKRLPAGARAGEADAVANLFDAVRCDGVERAAELLRLEPSAANARDEDGSPLLAYAHPELRRQAEMVAMLVANGADVNARFPDSATLLDRALSRGLVDYAALLRSHGAKTSAG